ncbi:MAG: ABC transporter ATP-binding protein [Candidatus Paceibacterota bacterium]|jgi:putative ABC transport system ATP-binding protein
MIRVKDLVKIYKSGDSELVVLNGLNLEVKNGEFLSIIGRSGSGKSTLLYQLGLLDHPNSGHIDIDEVDTDKLAKDERTRFRLNNLGYVFQDYALVPELTAFENVAIPLLMQGKEKSEIKKVATEVLDRIGLGGKLDNLPSQLSGGEQQRVSIARAISHNPKVLFADEPTANLDNETSDSVMKVFLALHKQGQTIIMVTHEPEYAAMTERTVLLDGGIIKSDKKN